VQRGGRRPGHLAGSDAARRSLARWERMAASPSAVLRMLRMIREIDVRDVLPGLGVPALIIQRRQDRITPPCHGRYLAAHLPGARYFEQPGDHLLWLGDIDAMFGQIREFLGEAGATPGPDAKTDRSSPSPAAPAAG
jgi:pimeloyl-ACP methyl ester carboxylesterase